MAGIQGQYENGYVGGNPVWKKITRSGRVVEHRVPIHAGPNLIAEYNAGVAASTPVQEYVYAGEIDSLVLIRRSDATKYGVTRNRQWSITALHDLANGTIVECYAYEITGRRTIYAANGTTVRTTSSFGNHFGYTNRRHDEESGLMYFRARFYNQLTGEFLSRDPMEFVDGMSLYRGYIGINSMDPMGFAECKAGYNPDHCGRLFSRYSLDVSKNFPTLYKVLNLIGLDKLSYKIHIEKKECCECCNNVWDRTDKSHTIGGLLEAAFSGKRPIDLYVRVGFSCSGTMRESKCSGNGGASCCQISGEIGAIMQIKAGFFGVGARVGIAVREKCCVDRGGNIKCRTCFQVRFRYFGNFGLHEWGHEVQSSDFGCIGDGDVGDDGDIL
ncbi:MAG: RHS repeat-associated core domain-containing protein [Planctomycetaceae bacterium]|nr:RHS repeat-associated core domain-containing protein [Planctomycetaceae bacterium]